MDSIAAADTLKYLYSDISQWPLTYTIKHRQIKREFSFLYTAHEYYVF